MPDKLRMTVPASFRRHSAIPGVLVLRRGKIGKQEIDIREGYSVTKPARAIVDLILEKSVSMDIISQALREAQQRGLLWMADFQSYRKGVMTRSKAALAV